MLEKIDVVHFSPAGNTRKAALLLAQAMAGRTEEYDLTRPHNTGRSFGPGDVVIVAGPVYGGRLPAVMLERLAEIQGNGAFAVTLAVYGNRAYEDALIELDDSVEKQGFRRLASAALAAQHSIVTQLAAGRPDQEDAEEITRFAEEILSKYEEILSGKEQPGNYSVQGNRPYKNWNPMQAVPLVSNAGFVQKSALWKQSPGKNRKRRIPPNAFSACGAYPFARKKPDRFRSRSWPVWNRSWRPSGTSGAKMNGSYKQTADPHLRRSWYIKIGSRNLEPADQSSSVG